jgi:hypothetical protein
MAINASLPAAKSRFGVSLPLLVALVAFVVELFSGSRLLSDPDTYWHIAVGRWILAHHAVPHVGIFSGSMPQALWVPHEWLAETIFASLYDHWGWNGPVLATAAALAMTLAILTRALLRWLEPMHALAGAAAAWGLVLSRLLARPHILAVPIMVLWFAALVEARERNRAPPLWIAALMCLWANLHGSFALGLVFAAFFAGEAVILAPDRGARLGALKQWSLFIATSLLAALLTPNGLAGLWLPVHVLGMKFTLSVLMEWQSPDFQTFQPLELWLVVALALALGFGVKLPPTRIAMLLLLLHMSLTHQRLVEVLGFLAPLLIAPSIGETIRARRGRPRAAALDGTFAELAGRASWRGFALVALVAAAVAAGVLQHPLVRKSDPYTPAAALDYAKAHDLTGRVFNEYSFGGYLIFNGIKPFIDGRADMYGDAFVKRYVEATRDASDDLAAMLDQYHATWTLFAANSPAATLMNHLPGWKRVYADDTAVIHVRTDAAQ